MNLPAQTAEMIRQTLIEEAAQLHAEHPQYNGYFDGEASAFARSFAAQFLTAAAEIDAKAPAPAVEA